MNNIFRIGTGFFALVFLFSSCEDPAARIKNEKLQVRLEKGEIFIDSQFEIGIGTANEVFDSVYVNGKLWDNYDPKDQKVALSYSQVGSKSLALIGFKNGDQKLGNVNFKILSKKAVKPLLYEIIEVLPHDPKAYTQGYEFYNGFLFESLGQYRQSELRKQEFPSGKIVKSFPLPSEIFAEGLSVLRDTIYQVTWKARKCYQYDLDLNQIGSNTIPTVEGWGLTNDGENLILSDGSNQIFFLDAKMNIKRSQEVYNQRLPLGQINELEYANGKLYANIYTSENIFVINPKNGVAEAYLDLGALRQKLTNPAAEVLNGIAYIKETGNFLVTGKYWDKAFIIKLI